MSKSELSPIKKKVLSAVENYFGSPEEVRFVLAVSGGPDSMCLLYIFHRLGIDTRVVHINYGKRGEAAYKDAELVEEMAFQWGFDCHTVKADPGEAEGENFQQWARDFRYSVFRAEAEEYDADGIALAHHRDDQVETVMMKQFRGAGLAAWSAMQVWDGELFRPLLEVSREEIEQFCERKNVPFRRDATNLQSNYARNFIRNEWIPELEKHFPGWKENLLRLSGQARLFEDALQWISDRLTDDRDRMYRKELLHMEPSLLKALILFKLKNIDPGVDVSKDALGELEHLDSLQSGRRIQLTDTLSVMRDREYFKIVFEQPDSLTVIDLNREQLAESPVIINDLKFEIEEAGENDFDKALVMDASKMGWPLKLRRWKEGDRFRPLGMDGHQNVSDHLTNVKVSSSEKHTALVIESFEETICAVIFPPIEKRVPPGTISEAVKWESSTPQSLTVKRID